MGVENSVDFSKIFQELKHIEDVLNSLDTRLKKLEDYIYSKPVDTKETTKEDTGVDTNEIVSKVREIENEVIKMMEEKKYPFIYESVIKRLCKEKGIDYKHFLSYVQQLYEKEKGKWYKL